MSADLVTRNGLLVDLNVTHANNSGCQSPEIVTDLPPGGRRFLHATQGYERTSRRGAGTSEDGSATGVLLGRLLRGTQASPR
jgi:N-acyl-D-aspartate/D-glutamate deacylase